MPWVLFPHGLSLAEGEGADVPDQPVAAMQLALPNARTATALGDRSRVPGANMILSVPGCCLCRCAGAWAGRTPIPAEGMAVQRPSQCGPCPTPTGAVAAPAIPAAGHPCSWLASLQLACLHSPSQCSPAHAMGRPVLPCCAQALPSLWGPWLPAVLALPWNKSIPPEGRRPEQEGLFETSVTLDSFTLWGVLLLAWLTCAGLPPLQCPPAAGARSVWLLP